MSTDRYHHLLSTGSGRTEIDLSLADDSATVEIHSRWMGSGKEHYRFTGKHFAFSPSHGWVELQQATYRKNDGDTVELDIAGLRCKMLCEYFIVGRSPHHEHPDDLGMMQVMGYAHWHDHFELMLVVQKSSSDNLYGMQEFGMDGDGTLPDREQFELLMRGILMLDKTKYQRRDD